ncbi:hypothetical protein S245_005728, partial [Arachis hypogaea]
SSAYLVSKCNQNNTVDLWHKRLGHSSLKTVMDVMNKISLHFSSHSAANHVCEICPLAKMHRLHFSLNDTVYMTPLELVFVDIWGPAPVISRSGFRYYISFVDAHSKYTYIFLLTNKSQSLVAFQNYKAFIENQIGQKIKALQTDLGMEFMSHAFTDFLANEGIHHRKSCPYTHHQQGSVERKHRHITEVGLSLLATASLPMQFWEDAFLSSVYIINRLPTPVLDNNSPFEVLFKHQPDYTFFKIFGCMCFPFLRPYSKTKFNYKSEPCLFLGYDSNFKGYKCMAKNGKIYMARHVLFHEYTFSYQKLFSNTLGRDDSSKNNPEGGSQLKAPAFTIIDSTPPSMSSSNQATKSLSIHSDTGLQITSEPLHDTSSPSHSGLDTHDTTSSHENEESRILKCHPPSASPTNSSPDMIPISDIETSLPSTTNAHSMTTRSKSGVFKPKALTVQQTDLLYNTPRTVAEALQCSHWREAMDKEFAALQKCKTWELTEPPANTTIIGSKWVFAIKKNAKGDILRYKARLIGQGFHQVEGIDYDQIYSPVVRPSTIRVILTIAVSLNWPLRQFDFDNAFLNGTLNETVYMMQPPGYSTKGEQLVCKLNKAIYGLKQAPRAWYKTLSTTLQQFGFKETRSDVSLFVRFFDSNVIYLLVYVDDIIVTGNNAAELDKLIYQLNNIFPLKDMGKFSYFLGLEASYLSTG